MASTPEDPSQTPEPRITFFPWQPAADVQALVDRFGLPPLRHGAELAAAGEVTFTEMDTKAYVANVSGHTVRYGTDPVLDSTSCTCASHLPDRCRHVAAVALLVLGRGRVPPEAAAGFSGFVRGYSRKFFAYEGTARQMDPAEDPDGAASAGAGGRLSDDECAELAATALTELRAYGGGESALAERSALTDWANDVRRIARRMRGGGRTDAAVRLLRDAIPLERQALRRVADAEAGDDKGTPEADPESARKRRLRRLRNGLRRPLIDALVLCEPAQTEEMLRWVEELLDTERDYEETIDFSHLWALLDDDQLAGMDAWFARRGDGRVTDWTRRLAIAEYFGDEARIRDLLAHAPEGTHVTVMRHHLEQPPTPESLATLAGYLDQGLVGAAGDLGDLVYGPAVADWLAASPRPEAAALLQRMAVELFDADRAWDSSCLLVQAFGRNEVTRMRALGMAGVPGERRDDLMPPAQLLTATIIDAVFLPPDPDLELVDVPTAELFDSDQAHSAAINMKGRLPATAANLAMASAFHPKPYPFLPWGFLPPDVSPNVITVYFARQDQGKPWLFWNFVVDLAHRYPPLGTEADVLDREGLAEGGWWPETCDGGDIDLSAALSELPGGDGRPAGTGRPAAANRPAVRRAPRPEVPDPAPADLHPQLITGHVATLDDVRSLGYTAGAAFFGSDGRLDGFLTDAITDVTNGAAWLDAARRFPDTGLWPLRVGPEQAGTMPSVGVHHHADAAYAIAPDPLWSFFMPGRHDPTDAGLTIDTVWERVADAVGRRVHADLARAGTKPDDVLSGLGAPDGGMPGGRLLLVACHRPSDVPWILDFAVPDAGVTPGLVTGLLRSWEERFAVVPERLTATTMELQCAAPPEVDVDKQKLAEEVCFVVESGRVRGHVFHDGGDPGAGVDAIGDARHWFLGWG